MTACRRRTKFGLNPDLWWTVLRRFGFGFSLFGTCQTVRAVTPQDMRCAIDGKVMVNPVHSSAASAAQLVFFSTDWSRFPSRWQHTASGAPTRCVPTRCGGSITLWALLREEDPGEVVCQLWVCLLPKDQKKGVVSVCVVFFVPKWLFGCYVFVLRKKTGATGGHWGCFQFHCLAAWSLISEVCPITQKSLRMDDCQPDPEMKKRLGQFQKWKQTCEPAYGFHISRLWLAYSHRLFAMTWAGLWSFWKATRCDSAFAAGIFGASRQALCIRG